MEEDNVYIFIGRKIKEFRTHFAGKGISQEELAKSLGVLPNSISRWETGTYKPKINELQKLADFFGISIGTFFPDKEEPQETNEKILALTRLSGELPQEDLEELIEYAKFRRARRTLQNNKK